MGVCEQTANVNRILCLTWKCIILQKHLLVSSILTTETKQKAFHIIGLKKKKVIVNLFGGSRVDLLRADAARPQRGCSPKPSGRSPEPAPGAAPPLHWLKWWRWPPQTRYTWLSECPGPTMGRRNNTVSSRVRTYTAHAKCWNDAGWFSCLIFTSFLVINWQMMFEL